jgi:hypothetical protein
MLLTEYSVQGAHDRWVAYLKKRGLEIVSVIFDQRLGSGIAGIEHLSQA